VIREISEAYWAPLGVWVVRDAARKAMSASPTRFGSLDEALAEMGRRINTPFSKWKSCSDILSGTIQSSLANFF
jgi:hypothetical protein